MALDEEQVRLACIDLAQVSNNARGEPRERAEAMAAWVGTDEVRLGCLKLAMQIYGHNARITVGFVLSEAVNFLEFVRPPRVVPPKVETPKAGFTRKRGRPRKT